MNLALWGREPLWQLIYVDDIHWAVSGRHRFVILIGSLVLWTAAGTPWSWKKTRGGVEVEWVGYWVDYSRFVAGISEARSVWLINWIERALQDRIMSLRRMSETLGRLGFASSMVEYIKPFLGPIYAWVSAAPLSAALPIPLPVRLVLSWIARQLRAGYRYQAPADRDDGPVELFRTDAKGEEGKVVLGGWRCDQGGPGTADWFSLEVSPIQAPWLFRNGMASPVIAAAELLATLVAVQLFVGPGPQRTARCASLEARTTAATASS